MEDKVIKNIKDFLKRHALLSSNNTLLVAFSGGIDSLSMLDALYKISKEHGFKLVAAHLNHNWRGLESKLEADRAEEYCLVRNIEFYLKTLPEDLPKTELEARNQRYLFLNYVAKETRATGILTGHTLSDQVETVLYRIIKGTGTIGLKGIPEVRYQDDGPPIYRPILTLTREETLRYCEENNLNPNIDSSNLKQDFVRNRIRLSLIPELKTYNQNIEQSILRLSELSHDAENLIEEYLAKINYDIYGNNQEISTKKFLELSDSAKRRIILDILISNGLDYESKKVEEILNFIKENGALKSGNTLSLTENKWLFVSERIIKIISSIKSDMIKSSYVVNLNGETHFRELGKVLKVSSWKGDKLDLFPKESSRVAYVDLSQINEPLSLRTRREGDRIQPFGMKEKVKLKKYLINKGIPEFERDKLLILATEAEILWVVGVGMSELLRVKNIPTHVLEIDE